MTDHQRLSFGLKTTPVNITYDDLLRVWQEADTIPEIEHAWLWDHYLPLFGPVDAPIHEGWTLLAALAAQTRRLRLGLMVSSNAARPPAVLGKIAATTDVISAGRLVLGIGVGATRLPGRPHQELADREYDAYGLTMFPPEEGIARLAEACAILRRMWTEDVFDFHGRNYTLRGTVCEPKPVQRPGPPVLIGAWGRKTLRVVAEHADIWNIPGPPHNSVDFVRQRNAVLDAHCAAVGRDPREITRSSQIVVAGDDAPQGRGWLSPAQARAAILELAGIGVTHIVVGPVLSAPEHAAEWLAEEIIAPVRAQVPAA